MDDYVGSGGLGPQPVHLGANADGGDDCAGRRFDGFRFLDDVFEGGVKICLALVDKAGGVGVAVDCGVVSEPEFPDDALGAAPAKVGEFDVLAVSAAADTTLAGVA